MNVNKKLLLLLITTNLTFIVYITMGSSLVTHFQFMFQPEVVPRKKILLWNSPHRREAAAFGTGPQAFIDAKCPVFDCDLVANSSEFWSSTNYSEIATFDAIVINVHELRLSSLLPQNYRRPERQRLVFFTQESPLTMASIGLDVRKLGGIFNWTMTYRMDSDIQLLYGRVTNRSLTDNNVDNVNSTAGEGIHHSRNKTGKVVWMASHCGTFSKREEYVAELAKYIQVDVFGGCGNFSCRRLAQSISDPECYVQLASKYKFYLSFENSICKHYVTEKFFSVLHFTTNFSTGKRILLSRQESNKWPVTPSAICVLNYIQKRNAVRRSLTPI